MQNNTFSRIYLRQNLIVLEEVTSTNDYLKQLLSNIKPLPEATAIMANRQVRGKGQRGNVWIDEPHATLALSFVLYPTELSVQQAFNLNMFVCLAIRNWISALLPQVQIKWPNDIYISDKKLGGVLIENQLSGGLIRSTVIGIGVNVKQQLFPAMIQDKATSFYLEKPSIAQQSLEFYASSLLSSIMAYYEHTDLRDTSYLLDRYNRTLFRRGIPASFEIAGATVIGTIQGVESNGKLNIIIDNRKCLFDLKEIRFK